VLEQLRIAHPAVAQRMPALQSASLVQSRRHEPNAEQDVSLGQVPPQSQMPPGAVRAQVPPMQSALTRH
jgi:hypothetical protein